MTTQETTPRLTMRLLDERVYSVSRKRPVVCRLWKMTAKPPSPVTAPVYAIGMETLTERCLYCVGSHEESVRALFAGVTAGKLAPLHLGDVVEDYLWERKQIAKEAGEIPERTLQTNQSMV
jgi:hypothetical protein